MAAGHPRRGRPGQPRWPAAAARPARAGALPRARPRLPPAGARRHRHDPGLRRPRHRRRARPRPARRPGAQRRRLVAPTAVAGADPPARAARAAGRRPVRARAHLGAAVRERARPRPAGGGAGHRAAVRGTDRPGLRADPRRRAPRAARLGPRRRGPAGLGIGLRAAAGSVAAAAVLLVLPLRVRGPVHGAPRCRRGRRARPGAGGQPPVPQLGRGVDADRCGAAALGAGGPVEHPGPHRHGRRELLGLVRRQPGDARDRPRCDVPLGPVVGPAPRAGPRRGLAGLRGRARRPDQPADPRSHRQPARRPVAPAAAARWVARAHRRRPGHPRDGGPGHGGRGGAHPARGTLGHQPPPGAHRAARRRSPLAPRAGSAGGWPAPCCWCCARSRRPSGP